MKKKNLSLIIITIFLVIACKESTTEPTINSSIDDYFPFKNGSLFIYDMTITDSNGVTETGKRFMSFNDSTVVEGTTYQIQKDSFVTLSVTQNNSSFLRISNMGVFSYADTTGFTDTIPDSLKQYVMVDREVRILFYPLTLNLTYPVYTVSVNYLITALNILDIDAKVESEETLDLTLNNIAVQSKAYKIKYTFIIRLGTDVSDEIKYEAYGWAVKDIGFVKWDGDAEFFNFLLNENIFPSNSNVKMDMISYQF